MPADDYTPKPEDPLDSTPILFRPKTFDRHADVVDYIERYDRARYPRDGRGRTTRPAKGAWGYLDTGNTISAASGLTLGSGTVQLCSRSGTTLTADGDNVTVYNSGGTITGPKTLELDWMDGDWAVCECGCQCTLNVLNCAGGYLVGATVTIKDSGGTTLDSGTTDSIGHFVTTEGCGDNRTVTIAATGYTTTDFTGTTLSCGTVTDIDMSTHVESGRVCCCLLLKSTVLNWSAVGTDSGGGTTTFSGTGTWNDSEGGWLLGNLWPGHPGFPVLATLSCSSGVWFLTISYYDAFVGDFISCSIAGSTVECDPLNLVFDYPDLGCTNFPDDIGYVTFVVTITS